MPHPRHAPTIPRTPRQSAPPVKATDNVQTRVLLLLLTPASHPASLATVVRHKPHRHTGLLQHRGCCNTTHSRLLAQPTNLSASKSSCTSSTNSSQHHTTCTNTFNHRRCFFCFLLKAFASLAPADCFFRLLMPPAAAGADAAPPRAAFFFCCFLLLLLLRGLLLPSTAMPSASAAAEAPDRPLCCSAVLSSLSAASLTTGMGSASRHAARAANRFASASAAHVAVTCRWLLKEVACALCVGVVGVRTKGSEQQEEQQQEMRGDVEGVTATTAPTFEMRPPLAAAAAAAAATAATAVLHMLLLNACQTHSAATYQSPFLLSVCAAPSFGMSAVILPSQIDDGLLLLLFCCWVCGVRVRGWCVC